MAEQTELRKASEVALRDYMGLENEETLLIVTDVHMRDIAYSLYQAGTEISQEAFIVEMKSRQRHGEEPPDPIVEMMKSVDVVVCPTSKSMTHTEARRSASRVGVRVGTLPSVSAESMIRCMKADYRKIIETTDKVAEVLKGAEEIHVTSSLGTDIKFSAADRKIISSSGVMRKIGDSGNLISGEVYLAPPENTLNGSLVFDGSIGGIGLLDKHVKVNLREGYATRFSGKEPAKKLSTILREVGGDALAIGEFGIGTNYMAKLTGNILEDEKVLGTVHFAFGNNITMGGNYDVPLHIDGIITKPTVSVDGINIIEKGKMLL